MASESGEPKLKRLRNETVRGAPIHVRGRTLIPEARIVSYGRARADIGSQRIGGWSTGFAHVIPLAVIEQTEEGERRIATTDATATALRGMLSGALAILIIFPVIRWLIGQARKVEGTGSGD